MFLAAGRVRMLVATQDVRYTSGDDAACEAMCGNVRKCVACEDCGMFQCQWAIVHVRHMLRMRLGFLVETIRVFGNTHTQRLFALSA